MAERDAYEVLQVSPQANDLVIKAAFRVLAGLSPIGRVRPPRRDAWQNSMLP